MIRNFFEKLFSSQESEEIKMQKELKKYVQENCLKEFKITNTIEENGMSEEIKQEKVLVEDAPKVEEVSEETEVVPQEQVEQPKNEGEENEPSEPETVETPQEEVVEEQPQAEQEEPKQEEMTTDDETIEDKPQEEVTKVEDAPVEIEPVELEQPTDEKTIEAPVNEVSVAIKTMDVSEREAELLKEVEMLKAEKAEKEIQMKKMELSKEVEQDFAGVPGKVEDKVEMVYEIKNSELSSQAKDFILNSLKSLSVQNLNDCKEIGHDQKVEIDEKAERENKVKKAMEEYNLTENQAFLYVNGDRTLKQAQEASMRVQRKRK